MKRKNNFKPRLVLLLVFMFMTLSAITAQAATNPKYKLEVTSTTTKISENKITLSKNSKLTLNSIKYCTRKGKATSSAYSTKNIKPSKVKWKTSNKTVATVKNGVITAKANGKATITATYKKAKCKIKVVVSNNAYTGCKHTWDSGRVTKEATCQSTGKIQYTCTTCNTAKTDNIPTTNHVYVGDTCKWCNQVNPILYATAKPVIYNDECPNNNGKYHVFTDVKADSISTPYEHPCSKCGLDIRGDCNSKDSTGHYWNPTTRTCWVCGTKQPYFKADMCVCSLDEFGGYDTYYIKHVDSIEATLGTNTDMRKHLVESVMYPEKFSKCTKVHSYMTLRIYIGNMVYNQKP